MKTATASFKYNWETNY